MLRNQHIINRQSSQNNSQFYSSADEQFRFERQNEIQSQVNIDRQQLSRSQQLQQQQQQSQQQRQAPRRQIGLFQSFKRCCCHHAPAIIILDIILILIVVGEIILIYPNKIIDVEITDPSSSSTVTGPNYNLNFTNPNQSNQLKNSTKDTITTNISLWDSSASSVFMIPINTILISIGLRLLFCKLQLEVLKMNLILILTALYLSSMIGLTLYSTQSNQDDFKQNFFLQYIILTISLVLGFLTLMIALVMMSYYFMKVLQHQIKKMSHLFLIEQMHIKSQNKNSDQDRIISEAMRQRSGNQILSSVVDALQNNRNQVNLSQVDQPLMGEGNNTTNADISVNLLNNVNSNNNRFNNQHHHINSNRVSINSSRNSQMSQRMSHRSNRFQQRRFRRNINNSIERQSQPTFRNSQQNSQRSRQSQRHSGRFVVNGVQHNNQQLSQSSERGRGSIPRQQFNITPVPLQNLGDRSNPSTFSFVLPQANQRMSQVNMFNNQQRSNSYFSPQHSQSQSLGAGPNIFESSETSSQVLLCSICRMRLVSNIVKMQPCQHMYHKNCINQWQQLQSRQLQQECPACCGLWLR